MSADIMQACFDHLLTLGYSPTPTIVWPGIQTEPPDEDMWLKPGYFPNRNREQAWNNDACVETTGFFQILVYFRVRPDVGVMEPAQLADALVDHFPKGTVLGPVGVFERPSLSPIVEQDASKSYIPVTVYYLGLT